jgi:hypothetical protein
MTLKRVIQIKCVNCPLAEHKGGRVYCLFIQHSEVVPEGRDEWGHHVEAYTIPSGIDLRYHKECSVEPAIKFWKRLELMDRVVDASKEMLTLDLPWIDVRGQATYPKYKALFDAMDKLKEEEDKQ